MKETEGATILAYGLVAFSGFLMGLLATYIF